MDGLKTIVSFWDGLFSGAMLVLGSVIQTTSFSFRMILIKWGCFRYMSVDQRVLVLSVDCDSLLKLYAKMTWEAEVIWNPHIFLRMAIPGRKNIDQRPYICWGPVIPVPYLKKRWPFGCLLMRSLRGKDVTSQAYIWSREYFTTPENGILISWFIIVIT